MLCNTAVFSCTAAISVTARSRIAPLSGLEKYHWFCASFYPLHLVLPRHQDSCCNPAICSRLHYHIFTDSTQLHGQCTWHLPKDHHERMMPPRLPLLITTLYNDRRESLKLCSSVLPTASWLQISGDLKKQRLALSLSKRATVKAKVALRTTQKVGSATSTGPTLACSDSCSITLRFVLVPTFSPTFISTSHPLSCFALSINLHTTYIHCTIIAKDVIVSQETLSNIRTAIFQRTIQDIHRKIP